MEAQKTLAERTPVRIVMDDRESLSTIAEELHYTPFVEVVTQRMAVGDFLVEGRYLFERKTWMDLVASLMDGRLFSQAKRLAEAAFPAAVILEGDPAVQLKDSEMRREAIEGALVCLALTWGLPVLPAPSPGASVRYMIYAGRQAQRLAVGATVRHGRKPHRKRRAQLYLLQGLPGIGPGRAASLLDAFDSVAAVMTADVAELRKVSGIGMKTAEAIQELLH